MSQARAKGSAWETRLVKWLKGHGYPNAERCDRPGMASPTGDIGGVPGWGIEAKHRKGLSIETWFNQIDKKLADLRLAPMVVTPWANHHTDRAWCVLDAGDLPFRANDWQPGAWRHTPAFTRVGPLLDAAKADADAVGSGLWYVRVGRLAVVELAVWAEQVGPFADLEDEVATLKARLHRIVTELDAHPETLSVSSIRWAATTTDPVVLAVFREEMAG